MMPVVIFDPRWHAYYVGNVRLPSVTKILRIAGVTKPLDHIDPAVLEKARNRGVAVHALCQAIDESGEYDTTSEFAPYAEQYRKAAADLRLNPIQTEKPIHHPVERYAGTPDLVCWINAERTILDRKATYAMDNEATPLQCVAYAEAWNALRPNEPITQIVGLHLKRDDYAIYPYHYEDARLQWFAALTKYREIVAAEQAQKRATIITPPRRPIMQVVRAKESIKETHPFLMDEEPEVEPAKPSPVSTEITAEVQVERDVSELMQRATALTVVTPEQAQLAADTINECARRRKKIEEWFEPLVSQAHGAWKELVARRTAALDQYAEPEGVIRTKLTAYQAEQTRIKREAAERAAREARERAEAEKAARLAEAQARGDEERAARIAAAPAPVVPVAPVVIEPEQKIKGAAFQEKWTAQVVDMAELVRAIADGQAPITLVKVDQTALNGLARSLKSALSIPGVQPVCEQTMRATGR